MIWFTSRRLAESEAKIKVLEGKVDELTGHLAVAIEDATYVAEVLARLMDRVAKLEAKESDQ